MVNFHEEFPQLSKSALALFLDKQSNSFYKKHSMDRSAVIKLVKRYYGEVVNVMLSNKNGYFSPYLGRFVVYAYLMGHVSHKKYGMIKLKTGERVRHFTKRKMKYKYGDGRKYKIINIQYYEDGTPVRTRRKYYYKKNTKNIGRPLAVSICDGTVADFVVYSTKTDIHQLDRKRDFFNKPKALADNIIRESEILAALTDGTPHKEPFMDIPVPIYAVPAPRLNGKNPLKLDNDKR